jgi:hypothetical protein
LHVVYLNRPMQELIHKDGGLAPPDFRDA